ncbi:MAG: DUF998 domain-containing protein [Chloroflexi bacterium]|nr:DUF998 domain-containing protein [Chloroflexota bacterium]
MNSQIDLVISRLILRKTLGILGILLPFMLVLGNLIIFRDGLENSISGYYHTGMRNVFVGVLFAYGLFLFSYRGYERKDDIAGDLGCVFAIGVAIFPTTPENPTSQWAGTIGLIHLAFAMLLFSALAYFAICLFTKTRPGTVVLGRKKKQRNIVYRSCGYAIVICIVVLVLLKFLPGDITSSIEGVKPVLLFESLALVAFGISWLVKGEALFRDEA